MKFAIGFILFACAVSAQAFSVLDLVDTEELTHHLFARGFDLGGLGRTPTGGIIDASGRPQKIGTVNKLLSGVQELAKGAIAGLAPGIMSVYQTLIPSTRILLAALDIHMCRPQTSIELLLWDVKDFINNQVRENLRVPVVPLCLPSEENAPSKEMRERITKSQKADEQYKLRDSIKEKGEGDGADVNFGDAEAEAGAGGEGKLAGDTEPASSALEGAPEKKE